MTPTNQKTVSFSVPDMHCQSCPKLIEMDLKDAPGVISASASLESKTVVVLYDASLTNVDMLASVIKNSGYTPQPLA